ncbi:hypothetical protein [Salidesulfovibrio brasiliensis]|uniref:hypothetical protein n=1 Tax=Salidesulfovibrio brasiliensis TaxID=221711 RepID=UPI0006D0DAB1|nr:hypothetical protein [Salidesulfovibrio brasiliensis]
MKRLALLCCLLSLFVFAGCTTASHTINGNQYVSTMNPSANITVPDDFTYVGHFKMQHNGRKGARLVRIVSNYDLFAKSNADNEIIEYLSIRRSHLPSHWRWESDIWGDAGKFYKTHTTLAGETYSNCIYPGYMTEAEPLTELLDKKGLKRSSDYMINSLGKMYAMGDNLFITYGRAYTPEENIQNGKLTEAGRKLVFEVTSVFKNTITFEEYQEEAS